MKKLSILAIMACCAMLAVSCNNQPKEEEQPVEEVVVEEVVVDSTVQEVVADTTATVTE